MRATPDHCLHHMFDDVAAAAGFSRDDIESWGGEVQKRGSVPWPHTETFKALIRGDVDAIFDEAASSWVPQALDAGIKILPLAEHTVQSLEAMGYRRAVLPRFRLSEIAGRRVVARFLRLDGVRSRGGRRRAGDGDLRRARCAQDAHPVGGTGRFAGGAHGARGARYAADRAAASGRRAILEEAAAICESAAGRQFSAA